MPTNSQLYPVRVADWPGIEPGEFFYSSDWRCKSTIVNTSSREP